MVEMFRRSAARLVASVQARRIGTMLSHGEDAERTVHEAREVHLRCDKIGDAPRCIEARHGNRDRTRRTRRRVAKQNIDAHEYGIMRVGGTYYAKVVGVVLGSRKRIPIQESNFAERVSSLRIGE